MNINEIYNSLADFWNAIFPVFLLHVFALIAIRWVLGVRLDVLGRMEGVLGADAYKRWKSVLDEFELRSKLPFLMLIALILYLVLFNSLVLGSLGDLSITSFRHSETDLWWDSRDIDRMRLAEIASYAENPEIRAWEIAIVKESLLNDYRGKYPQLYEGHIKWTQDQFSKWYKYYETSIVFLIFLVAFMLIRIFAGRRLFQKRRSAPGFIGKFFVLFLLGFLWLSFARYKAEAAIEEQRMAELNFIASRLIADPEAQPKKLNDEAIQAIKCRLYEDFKRQRERSFWWSRTLESYRIVERTFPTTSDQEFHERHRDLENCSSNRQY